MKDHPPYFVNNNDKLFTSQYSIKFRKRIVTEIKDLIVIINKEGKNLSFSSQSDIYDYFHP